MIYLYLLSQFAALSAIAAAFYRKGRADGRAYQLERDRVVFDETMAAIEKEVAKSP